MGFDLGTAIAGAGTGFLMGGPMGALAGGAIGGFGNDILGNKTGQSQFQAQLDPEVLKQQKALAEVLKAQAAGQGPNLAQEQLKRATSQNISQAAALAASQKGINPALAARQALQAGTMAQQEAAGQSGVLQVQQQLANQQAYANLLSTQQQQLLGKQKMEQDVAEANARAQAQQTAGIMGALGTLGGAYIGMQGKTPTTTPTPTQQLSTMPQLTMPQLGSSAVQQQPMSYLSEGGQVEGVAVEEGDSDANDTVPAMLSPGEIVIPRSILESDDPGAMAKKFVEKTLKQGPSDSGFYANGGMTPDYIAPGAYDQIFGLGSNAIPKTMGYADSANLPSQTYKRPRADFNIPERGYLGNELAQEVQARKNWVAQQTPSPLMQQQAQEPNILTNISDKALPEYPSPTKKQQTEVTEQQDIVKPKPTIADKKDLGLGVVPKTVGQAIETEEAGIVKRMQDIQKQKQDIMKEAMAKSEEADKALDAMQPQDFWADKSTGTKIGAGIALALGAYSSTISGGPNQAMQVIDSAINRDLQLQKEKYQRAKERGASIRTAYADQVAMLGDQESAELTMLNNYYKKIDMQLKMRESATSNEVAKLNIQKLRQEIGQSAEANNYKRLERMTMMKLAQGQGQANDINPELLPEEVRKRYVSDPEFGGLATDVEGKKEISKNIIEYRNAKDLINTLQEISKTPGRSLNPQLRAKAETAASVLKGKLRGSIVGPGAVSESEWKLLNNVVSNPSDFFSLDSVTQSRLASIGDMLDANMSNTAKVYGITPKMKPTETNAIYVRVPGQQPVRIAKSNLQAAQERARRAGQTLEVSDVGF